LAFEIVYKRSVQRDLKRLDKAEAKRLLERLEKNLAEKADTFPVLKGKFAGLRKYRMGEYRAIYAVIGDQVLVLRIAHRKEAYKKNIE
jgi:mRNA interferase RelE/StbE